MNRIALAALLALGAAACARAAGVPAAAPVPTGFPAACAPGEVQVMLLGTYHFDNPGQDDVNPKIDDMLVPRRQAELEELAVRLARWQPEQIAVEVPFSDSAAWRAAYERYRAGTLRPNRGEVVQVGFRLAHRLGHPAVYPIDHHMRIGNDSIGALYGRRPEMRAMGDSIQAILRARTDSGDAVRPSTSVIQHLREGNSEAGLHGGNSFGMFGAMMPVGEGGNYGGPEVIARWYERNIKMAHHLHRVLRPGTRRILAIVGSGHVPPIRNILDEDPRFCPVSPLPYLQ